MGLPKAKFREVVFHLLYSRDFAEQEDADLIEMAMHISKTTRKNVREALDRAVGIEGHLPLIDEIIRKTSKEYAFDRISGVERNILRLAIFELLYDAEIPGPVVLSEGIRLCRKFGTMESADFINAILDEVLRDRRPNPAQPLSV